ncbi:metal ABC transporter permease [Oscillatoria amoena NRMC-F 0135]|nr:metal ABC transporter permease [Oscillatoria laete-virens]MDL5045796.1 metal ABC transporter permease [Oscillatoria amoena NRMC-F 0135]MDL5055167.1 metal ABC transporter permease [Oscillatoria laete-virens NRMC-F 0139]
MSDWTSLDAWIILTGALIGMACALPGLYLLLMRRSMMGDAISHAVLPGLAIAFLVTGSREPWAMLMGAAAAGLTTALLSQWIQRLGGIEDNASLGVVFCSLFALGLILIRLAADHVDLDPNCVLYGSLETAVIDDGPVPQVVWMSGGILLLNLLLAAVFYKELRIAAFDPALAQTLGLRPELIRQSLNVVVSVTAVLAFESVGSILVIAILVVPAATAGLLSRRLGPMIALTLLIAAICAPLGHWLAVEAGPALAGRWLGRDIGALSTAGMMAVAGGLLLACAIAFDRAKQFASPSGARRGSEVFATASAENSKL